MAMQEPEPMVPQEATYETTETRSDRQLDSQGDSQGDSPGDSQGNSPGDSQRGNQPSSKELLSRVLVETLSRRREDTTGLIDHLRQWRSTLADQALTEVTLAGIVGQVLLYRLGPEAKNIPENLRQEVGEVLWNDPASQTRLNRLWTSLGSRS